MFPFLFEPNLPKGAVGFQAVDDRHAGEGNGKRNAKTSGGKGTKSAENKG